MHKEPHAQEPHAQEPHVQEPGRKALLPLHSLKEGRVGEKLEAVSVETNSAASLVAMEPGDGHVDFGSPPTIWPEIKLQVTA